MKIEGVKEFVPEVYTDYRGDLWTIWKYGDKELEQLNFNHDKVSTSRKNVIRGLHGDFKSWKLVTCLYGELYFVVLDNRRDSKTYRKWDSIILDDRTRKQILLPPGVANGFCVLSKESVFHYKWCYPGEYPDVEKQFTIKWNDPRYKIDWPITKPILQPRDK